MVLALYLYQYTVFSPNNHINFYNNSLRWQIMNSKNAIMDRNTFLLLTANHIHKL